MNKNNYILCTGTYYESPEYYGDESDAYFIGIERTDFYGTLNEARVRAGELAELRREEYEKNLVYVTWWIIDSDGNNVR